MKKLSILLAFFMLFTAASYAKSAVVVAKPQPVKEVVTAKPTVAQMATFVNENPGLVSELKNAKSIAEAKAIFDCYFSGVVTTSCGGSYYVSGYVSGNCIGGIIAVMEFIDWLDC
jgi:hypothetical protein